jgi:class 3 adenylate cyclase/pimeloyl-ACP methyl ester carboxylesterase
MAEPQIRYVKTTDGVNIAYFRMGVGTAYVRMPVVPMDHIQLQYSTFGRGYAAAIAARMMLICYDGRGSGMSTRDVLDFSMETFLEDLRCVVDGLGIETFVLEAPNQMAPVGLTYAAMHPERVSRLIIRSGAARNRDLWSRRIASTHSMLTNAPDMYRMVTASMAYGSAASNEMAAFMSQCVDEQVAKRMYDVQGTLDATAILAEVRAPTLVTVEADDQVFRREGITKLAASIGASLVVITPPPRGQLDEWVVSAVPTVLGFLEEQGVIEEDVNASSRQGDVSPRAEARGSVQTVLFTDIVGHTEMMQRLGDEKGRDVLREHERITRDLLKQHGGAEVKTMGDGFMASFGSVTSAMECAIALQRAFAAHTESMPEPLHVRVGLNAGEPIEEDGDLFGATVILASRIAAKAGAGEVLVPDTVRGLLSGKGFIFSDRGEFVPKGFDESVRLWAVRWQS